jgi:FkbM family methyltransferase
MIPQQESEMLVAIVKNLLRPIKMAFSPGQKPRYYRESYSQYGEDMILCGLFEAYPPKAKFYVDIGAHHPQRFSNTYYFYKQGWRGLNVDAAPGSMREFHDQRPRDINIEAAVSDKAQNLIFYIFNEPALNTFSVELAQERNALDAYRIVERRELQTTTLSCLLARYLDREQVIDFLNIDVEGLDLPILQSLDWHTHRPRFLLVEDLADDPLKWESSPTALYLISQGYVALARTRVTTIFVCSKVVH